MSAKFTALVHSFLNTSAKLETIAADLRAQFEDPTDRRFVRSEVQPIVAAFYGVKMVEKERGSGATFPDTPKGKTAYNKTSLLVNMIVGKSAAQKPTKEIVVSRAMKAAAKSFVELCGSRAAALAALKTL